MAPILLIEDDPLIRFLVTTVLGEEGYSVISAPDGAAALDLLDQPDAPQPALVLLDVLMPVMDGHAFLQRYARRPAPRAPVVVFTAAQLRDHRDRYDTPDVVEVLRKPFDLDELTSVIGRHVRTPSIDVAPTD